ncbi:FAD/NAD(P)-binding domain-containing protein [Polychaeton citri CBS 116435]|uniref:FAD/NAD(P)-binding domain-containing protein n=1 Tax=Polychaeton citri CBS 116435 TaxID=1314669 RepID=A0A9P4UQ66_9PEZI|nr:FAD/NAD(P)-binding domain-containing protein [Polychaeton citri CBS 116435]
MAHSTATSSILIVGGGLAGLFCALECVRNGFNTRLLESRTSVQTAGDFITIGPTAIHALRRWPSISQALDIVAYNPEIYYHKQNGELVAGPMPAHPNFGRIISRPALHRILMKALEAEHVEINCGAKVVRYSETDDEGKVELSNGETIEAHMIVAADGIHSKSWTLVSGEEPAIYPSGLAIFRAAFPIEHAMSDPYLCERWIPTQNEDKMGFFLAPGSFGIVLFGQNTASWVWQHSENPDTSCESWAATLSPKDALKQLDEEGQWGADLRATIAVTPQNHIVDWRLMRRDMKREWVSPKGRLTQIGDAAHPFLPTTVNGGTQALEDAVSLACCLRLAVEKHGIGALPGGAKVHNALRIDRVAAIQLTGMERTKKHHDVDFEKVKKNPELVRNEPAQWQIEHDPQKYAEEQFDDCFVCVKGGKLFRNTNKPAEYTFKA